MQWLYSTDRRIANPAERGMKSDEDLLLEIGLRIKRLRELSVCSSYEKFAFDNDISRMHYWQIEKGKVNITIKTLNKILNIHKIEIEEFWKIDVNTPQD